MTKLFCSLIFFIPLLFCGCRQKSKSPSAEQISSIQLKRGKAISCGAPDMQFGSLQFETSCAGDVQEDFNVAIKLLHSFEYDEAEKAFAKVIDREPDCAMAYWGVAMSNFHPLWTAPAEAELKKGAKAVEIAKSLSVSKKEAAYIDALAAFYTNWQTVDHHTRTLNFENGMAKVYQDFPDDKEAAIFYALALNAAAEPTDTSFIKVKKAGNILQTLFPGQPSHPGIAHYLIHTYDHPELALLGLDAARKYAAIAPSSAHALHMPSHIFTQLGYWDECIKSNLASVEAAKCYAEAAGIQGHWDEELHGLDYLVYAYLQKGDNAAAKKQCNYLASIQQVSPINFKVAYAFAAIPARYVLENHLWKEAANLQPSPQDFPWQNFPWQLAIVHFTRLLGAVHIGDLQGAKTDLQNLNKSYAELTKQKDSYKANQVSIQIKAAEAWILMGEGKHGEALKQMKLAADMEDKTGKHPVTPCEVLPARELLGDMLAEMNMPDRALVAYEASLQKHPNRLNALYGAGIASYKIGDAEKVKKYFQQVAAAADNNASQRTEVEKSKQYLKALLRL